MTFTNFIKRPVLSTVISILIVYPHRAIGCHWTDFTAYRAVP